MCHVNVQLCSLGASHGRAFLNHLSRDLPDRGILQNPSRLHRKGIQRAWRIEAQLSPCRGLEILCQFYLRLAALKQLRKCASLRPLFHFHPDYTALEHSSIRLPFHRAIDDYGHNPLRQHIRCKPLAMLYAVLDDSHRSPLSRQHSEPGPGTLRVVCLGSHEHPIHHFGKRRGC